MGLFDRFSAKKPEPTPTPSAPPAERPAASGGVMPRLAEARTKLKAKDLAGASAIYEEVLASAGDRADVLMTLSADLGSTGHVAELIEIVAPRYDAERHGPAAGLNLLQAYLAVRNAEAAQHLLDLLFSLNRPELEERLIGFSRVIADLNAAEESAAHVPQEATKISLISISKPIWFYGLEAQAGSLLPAKAGKLRRVAFAQCAVPGEKDAVERAAHPENDLGRLTRGLPLWFAEAFTYSAGYEPLAAVGTLGTHYAAFPNDWVTENVRQLNDSADGGVDYVVTGSLRNRNDDFELNLRIWEVKKYRELKAFSTRWTPATADAALGQFHEQVRAYMEWTALPVGQGPAYATPPAALSYVQALGASLTLFLGEKNLLAPDQVAGTPAPLLAAAQANPGDVRAQLMLVSGLQRLRARGISPESHDMEQARTWLAGAAASAALGTIRH
jgi:hypothetical protein